jgi:hypothetical protein
MKNIPSEDDDETKTILSKDKKRGENLLKHRILTAYIT